MFETVIPNAISVYKQVKHLVGTTSTSGRVRIGMTDTDMRLVFENETDAENIGKILKESGILEFKAPKVAPKLEIITPKKPIEKQHSYNPETKVIKRKHK